MINTIDDIRRTVVPIIQQDAHDLHRIIVFGSYATGCQKPGSDLDIYVDGRFEYCPEDNKDTEQKIAEALSIPVDLITRSALECSVIRENLEQSIERDGLLIYG